MGFSVLKDANGLIFEARMPLFRSNLFYFFNQHSIGTRVLVKQSPNNPDFFFYIDAAFI